MAGLSSGVFTRTYHFTDDRDAGIKIRGMSAAVSGVRFVAHFGLDSADDQKTVVELLSNL